MTGTGPNRSRLIAKALKGTQEEVMHSYWYIFSNERDDINNEWASIVHTTEVSKHGDK